ncbi:hypothetical protein GNI_144630 [Gregarina niphandrodes]|uniref:Uncharacterized protein n=1 Tax=Gregarina niphandrodes TaxID=110365 RepID=A0A023AZW2_GRENI|nr:hypothetical protein GNI_144630 [Gregarina niphandrodes]EZG44703.1 hypothetical protein GNI_144630 [Gregarina niphandrodes]|eukprot:XP_011134138.1 hypothetical protein GNI_144630 [Gregarina niphandrodes]
MAREEVEGYFFSTQDFKELGTCVAQIASGHNLSEPLSQQVIDGITKYALQEIASLVSPPLNPPLKTDPSFCAALLDRYSLPVTWTGYMNPLSAAGERDSGAVSERLAFSGGSGAGAAKISGHA